MKGTSGSVKSLVNDKYFYLQYSVKEEKIIQQYLKLLHSHPQESPEFKTLMDKIYELVDKRQNDHRNFKAELGHDFLKLDPFNNPSYETDMPTYQGLNKMLKIYAGTATGIFKWIGRGTTASTPNPFNTALAAETGTRIDSTVTSTGFHVVDGATIRMLAQYASSLATHTVHQIGAFDASTTGMMLAIHDFAGQGFSHTLNSDAFSLGIIFELTPFGENP